MKKKILIATILTLLLLIMFVLLACSNQKEKTGNFSSKYVNLEVLDETANGRVLVDRDTGVLYLWYRDNNQYAQLTPLYNTDGSFKNISDFE